MGKGRNSQVPKPIQRDLRRENVQEPDDLGGASEEINNGGKEGTTPYKSKEPHVFMPHVFEEPQLSVGSFGKKFGLEGPV